MIEVVEHTPDGTRYRCRGSGNVKMGKGGTLATAIVTPSHDFYGYAMLKEAKAFEFKEATKRIACEQLWRDKLRGHGTKTD